MGNVKLGQTNRRRIERGTTLDSGLTNFSLVAKSKGTGNIENVGLKRTVLARAVRHVERIGRELTGVGELSSGQCTVGRQDAALFNSDRIKSAIGFKGESCACTGIKSRERLEAVNIFVGTVGNLKICDRQLASRTVEDSSHNNRTFGGIDCTPIVQIANRERSRLTPEGNRTVGNGEALGHRLKIVKIQRGGLVLRARNNHVVHRDTGDRRRTVHAGSDIDHACNRELIGAAGQILIPKRLQINRQIARNVNVAVFGIRGNIQRTVV